MSFLSTRSRVQLILLTILAFTLVSTSLALGLVVNGVITGCYENITGALRVETTTLPCLPIVETRVSWSQSGQPGPRGATGPTGAPGAPGPEGPSGPAGATGYELAASGLLHVDDAFPSREAFAHCPSGKKAVGGGYSYAGTVEIFVSQPFGSDWLVIGRAPGVLDAGDFTAFAVCATAP